MSDVFDFPLPSSRVELFPDQDCHPLPSRCRRTFEYQLDLFGDGRQGSDAILPRGDTNASRNSIRLFTFFSPKVSA